MQNFFHSVQLNVNNPHFLIMQGRITKVLNMKPEEILSMIEEAAGTRMFETKKQAALKTIEKKQLKVEEITKCIDEEIMPTLETLRSEKQDYQSWQSANSEFERLERLCIAYEYVKAEQKLSSADGDKTRLLEKQKELKEVANESTMRAEECSKKISDIEARREGEMAGVLQQLKSQELALSKELVKENTLLLNQNETLETEKESLSALKSQIEAAKKSAKEKEAELDACQRELTANESGLAAADEVFLASRERYQNACAGIADESSCGALSVPEQTALWEKREREAESKLNQSQQKLKYAKELLKELNQTGKTQSASHEGQLKEVNRLKSEISTAESKLVEMPFDEKDEAAMKERTLSLRRELSELRDLIDRLSASMDARLSFVFKDPEAGFDRAKVKGLVARLVRVSSSKAATALEITAGAKLYQVVVDTEQTGKLLLQKGELKKRVTILPLNKISARCTDEGKVSRAKSTAAALGGSAHLALELVGYEKEMRKAMEYVFGNTIICDSPEIAKAIAFDKLVRNRTVTLDGDTYDPAGTLTGGSKNSLGVLLSKLEELAAAKEQYAEKEKVLAEMDTRLSTCVRQGAVRKKLIADLDLQRHALKLCEEKLAEGSFAQTGKQIAETEAKMKSLEEVRHDLRHIMSS